MVVDMKAIRGLILMAVALVNCPAYAQYTDGSQDGVLTDMSSLYADNGGPGSVAAAKHAVADFGAEAKGIKADIISAYHQNKPDLGSSIASAWFDQDTPSIPTTSLRSCCKPRSPRPRLSGSPIRAVTPSTQASRRPNSKSSRANKTLPDFRCS